MDGEIKITKKITTRKLEETSWLAQGLADRMDIEVKENGESGEWNALRTFKFAVNCADTCEWGMYYDNDTRTNNRLIIVPNIPYGMQSNFLGLAERCKDAEGHYTVHVLVTHDLNSAVINVSRLMDAIRGVG